MATVAAPVVGAAGDVGEDRPTAPPGVPLVPGVVIERDVEYGRAPGSESPGVNGERGRRLVLDILRPVEPEKPELPAVVFIHGGGWRQGDKAGGSTLLGPLVATGHYIGFSVGYRLSQEATFPAQIHDCKAAIRWIRDHARRLGVEARMIGVWGSSAGGHLASLLGTSGGVRPLEGDCGTPGVSSRVTCVVDFCGPADFPALTRFERVAPPAPRTADSPESQLLGGRIRDRLPLAVAASPVTHASRDDPPFLIVHGTADPLVPFNQAERLYAALTAAAARPTMLRIEGGGHAIGGPEVLARVRTFLDRHLRGERLTITDATIQAPTPAARGNGSRGSSDRGSP